MSRIRAGATRWKAPVASFGFTFCRYDDDHHQQVLTEVAELKDMLQSVLDNPDITNVTESLAGSSLIAGDLIKAAMEEPETAGLMLRGFGMPESAVQQIEQILDQRRRDN